ncbi:beta-galactosidase GalB [Pinibacter soli]|uniref:Beta-galactosidase GalB n=1 Tax=Pinibacter soli TaxID=3044211 RepID=A0ABT6RJS5_9BACT|nr:beta-galactosidase GalB [Pinibacter soli]MDI3322726.1 beta-galactosidase GalB [Pinibacter soli]
MKRNVLVLLLTYLSFFKGFTQSTRTEENFDADWLFARYGLQADGSRISEPTDSSLLASTSFDDSNWRKLRLPHDWAVECNFRADLDGRTGKLPWRAIGWYRKHFNVPSTEKGKQFYIDFDGAMANAEVWLNGNKIGEQPYGYTSFRVDLTPYISLGKENVLAVRLNTEEWGSRWYPGGGIYRHVHLVKTEPVHVAQWGVSVNTPEITNEYGMASVNVSVLNNLAKTVQLKYTVDIYELNKNGDAGRKVVTSNKQDLEIKANQSSTGNVMLKVANPKLWDLSNTNRYMVRVSVLSENKPVDKYETFFGFRTIRFTHDNGFLLNGKRVQLQGTCNHGDLGALGAAANIHGLQRQLSILKSMGCNALRTSHNPPDPELLELADKMGFLVMDEAFDCFKISKDDKSNGKDYARLFDKWHEKDLSALVKRDRNHPSVILWSMGNEIPEQHYPDKFYLFEELKNIIRKYDTSRPVTCGVSFPKNTAFNGVELVMDVHGMNYPPNKSYGSPDLYERFLNFKGHENLPGFASESSSTISTRGEYFSKNFQVSSYDLRQPGWGTLPDEDFAALDKSPGICGEFVWTGFDYLGEPTPFNSDASILLNYNGLSKEELEKKKAELEKIEKNRPPSRSSYFGIIDLAGFPKDRYYLYQSRWNPDVPMVHILPHWNFPDRVGKITPVFIYTSGDEAELFLNGKSLGRKKKQPYEYRLRWDSVSYQPGELKAVAYKNGKRWAESLVKTTEAPAKLKISADKSVIKSDGEDLIFVTISVTDKNGAMVPTANNIISCKVEGPGEIVATDNGDATCLIGFTNPVRPAFNGLMLAIVKAKANQSGKLKLIVESEGLGKSSVTIDVKSLTH